MERGGEFNQQNQNNQQQNAFYQSPENIYDYNQQQYYDQQQQYYNQQQQYYDPQQQYYDLQQQYDIPVVNKVASTLALIALLFSILSLICCCCYGWIPALISVVFGIIALLTNKQGPVLTQAIIAIFIGALVILGSLALSTVNTIDFITAIAEMTGADADDILDTLGIDPDEYDSDTSDSDTDESTDQLDEIDKQISNVAEVVDEVYSNRKIYTNESSESSDENNTTSEESNTTYLEIGETFKAGELEITAKSADIDFTDYHDPFNEYTPPYGMKYVSATIFNKNTSDVNVEHVVVSDFACYADDVLAKFGTLHGCTGNGFGMDSVDFSGDSLKPGEYIEYTVYWFVPIDCDNIYIEYIDLASDDLHKYIITLQ